MKKLIIVFFALSLLTSCKNDGSFLTSTTGAAYEILVVADKSEWKCPEMKELFQFLESDIEGLPQKEPYLSVSRCSKEEFNSMLKPTRNILFVEIDSSMYTQTKVFYEKDRWASSQAIAKIVVPSREALKKLIETNGQKILAYFTKAEIDRRIAYLKKNNNTELEQMVYDQFGITLKVPNTIVYYKKGKDMLWLSSGPKDVRQDLLFYSKPYIDVNQLSLDSLLVYRDEVGKKLILGPVDDSYMTTEYKYDYPILRAFQKENTYCAEVRGLWKVTGAAIMGGPFVSHTSIDKLHQRLVTVEGFVFAPQKEKRSYVRQMEAVLYTVKMPLVLDEVIISE